MTRSGSYGSLQNLGSVPVRALPGPASARETPPKRKPGPKDLLAALVRGKRGRKTA